MTIASYSFLNTWTTCPHQAARRYILKDLPKEPETPEQAHGNIVHKAFESRLKTGQWTNLSESQQQEYEPFALSLRGFEVKPELMLGMTADGAAVPFWSGNVWLRGKLDAPIIAGSTALLFDWKTGKPREDPYELEIGALLLQAKHPEITTIHGQYVWLKEKRLGELHDCSDTRRTYQRVHAIMEDVGRATSLGEFLKVQGPLCGWCPVIDCEHNRKRAA